MSYFLSGPAPLANTTTPVAASTAASAAAVTAARNAAEVALFYPGFHARLAHRLANAMHRRGVPLLRTAAQLLPYAWQAPVPTEIVVREDARWPKVLIERFAETKDSPELHGQ